jgi:hypothetical protein
MQRVYTPFYSPEKSVMLMAMHYAPGSGESDTIRIEALVKEGWSVSSVDIWNDKDSNGHITMNFRCMRAIRRLFTDYSVSRVLILDYFWLQKNYYEEAYGENWHEKAKLLFDNSPGLCTILLPIDDPLQGVSSMRKQLEQLDESLTYKELDKDDDRNPLVRCTESVEADLSRIDSGRTHQEQKWRISGFALVFRKTTSLTDAIGSLIV